MAPANLRAVILTALRVEFEAVREFLYNSQIVRHPAGNIYEQGTFQANGRTWDVGIAEVGMGDSGAALETERAISFFDPHVIFFVGVAGGIKDVRIGDVVVSTKIYCYESGKAKEAFETRPEAVLSSYALVEQAKAERRSRDQEWLNRLPSIPEQNPRVRVGAIAAGEKVIASTKSSVYEFIRAQYGDALALEMEGYGFLKAAYANQHRAAAIAIRGISDLIDNKNDDTIQEPEHVRQAKASSHASAFAFQILANFEPNVGITGARQKARKVNDQIWDELFACLQEEDLLPLALLLEGVLDPLKRDLYPELSRLELLDDLRDVVERIDDLGLAVTWVGRVLSVFANPSDGEEIRPVPLRLKAWYDQHRQPDSQPAPSQESPGYLLVALDPVDDQDSVAFTAELHSSSGEILKTNFVKPGTNCSVDEVCDLLSEIIPSAGDVRAVEVFLPWQHLKQPVHRWKIRASSSRPAGKRSRNQRELWRIPRNTLVRSLDRLKDPQWTVEWLTELEKQWQQFQELNDIAVDMICCADCLEDELFEGALDRKLIFKFLIALPDDRDDLADLLFGVLESKVPVWIWSYEDPTDSDGLSNQIDELLTPENLRDSTTLSQSILDRREELLDLGLLFDCPTRIPQLPVLVVDEFGRLRQPAA